MKKLLPILLTFSIVLSVAFSASAMEYPWEEPSADNMSIDINEFPYLAIVEMEEGMYELIASPNQLEFINEQIVSVPYSIRLEYLGTWVDYTESINCAFEIDQIRWSSHDLYFGDKLIYPSSINSSKNPPSLNDATSSVINDTLYNDTLPSIGGVLTILTVCGVGILGMFVALKLIGRRSLINK